MCGGGVLEPLCRRLRRAGRKPAPPNYPASADGMPVARRAAVRSCPDNRCRTGAAAHCNATRCLPGLRGVTGLCAKVPDGSQDLRVQREAGAPRGGSVEGCVVFVAIDRSASRARPALPPQRSADERSPHAVAPRLFVPVHTAATAQAALRGKARASVAIKNTPGTACPCSGSPQARIPAFAWMGWDAAGVHRSDRGCHARHVQRGPCLRACLRLFDSSSCVAPSLPPWRARLIDCQAAGSGRCGRICCL